MEIEKNLVVSTAHITERDSELLQSGLSSVTAYDNEYFYLVYLNKEIEKQHLSENGFSEAFASLYEFAAKHEENFRYLKLDRDGDELEGFPTFEW
jgi:hypothetical protein